MSEDSAQVDAAELSAARRWLSPWGLLSAATTVTAALTVAGFLARAWWVFDVVCSFRVQYAACLAAAALLFVVGKRRRQALAAAAFCAVNAVLIAPMFVGGPGGQASGEPIRFLWANVYIANRDHAALLDLVRDESPDVIALAEINKAWAETLGALEDDYPHRVGPRRGPFGIALLSRLPLLAVRLEFFGEAGVPSIVATVETGGGRVDVIATHPVPPLSRGSAWCRNDHLREMAAACAALDGPVVVLGDLNCTPWSPFFRDLLRDAGLRNAQRGYGPRGTWPTFNPLMRVPIDHCLVSPGIVVRDFRIGPGIGADHLPILVELSLP